METTTTRYWKSPESNDPGFHAYNAAEAGCELLGRTGGNWGASWGRGYTVYAAGPECPGEGWTEVIRGVGEDAEDLEEMLFDEAELFD